MARRLYVEPCSSSSLVSATIAHQLRAAAEAELLKHYTAIDIDDLYSEADHAVDALSILLGENEFFFGNKNPGLFDASMFAYTYLLLDEKMDWKEKKLLKALEKHQNLVQHRQRIHKRYFVGSK